MDLKESIDRILDSEAIIGDAFYDQLLDRYPQVQRYFEQVDLDRQAVMLTMALLVIQQNHGGAFHQSKKYLQSLGAKHCEWGIPKEVYHYFHEALLETLARFLADDWNEQLRGEWAKAIEQTTEQMLTGYEDVGTPSPNS